MILTMFHTFEERLIAASYCLFSKPPASARVITFIHAIKYPVQLIFGKSFIIIIISFNILFNIIVLFNNYNNF